MSQFQVFDSFKINKSKRELKASSNFPNGICTVGNKLIITGGNGSGKTRLLKAIHESLNNLQNGGKRECVFLKDGCALTKNDLKDVQIINYSHFDAKLQSPRKFSSYVICRAQDKLKNGNYEETALNSILYMHCLGMKSYRDIEEDFEKLNKIIAALNDFEIDVKWNSEGPSKRLEFFGKQIQDAELSPGQIYILRMIVGCHAYDEDGKYIFLFDEPETHLHPKLLLNLMDTFIKKFQNAQFVFATHSVELISGLISMYNDVSVIEMQKGEIYNYLRSDNESVLKGLFGEEARYMAVAEFLKRPNEYACDVFCAECFQNACIVEKGKGDDPQAQLAIETINSDHTVEEKIDFNEVTKNLRVVDYGAGMGRLIECFCDKGITQWQSYNPYNVEAACAEACANRLRNYGINGESICGATALENKIEKRSVDYVFMVNVLHEIPIDEWQAELKRIYNMLQENGKLIIIEQEELNIGESDYIVLTSAFDDYPTAKCLFGSSGLAFRRHNNKHNIIEYEVTKAAVKYACDNFNMLNVLQSLNKEAYSKIESLKTEDAGHEKLYKRGLSLAFWLNQYFNTSNVLNESEGE